MLTEGGEWGEGELEEGSQRYKLPITRQVSMRDAIYSLI